MRKIFTLTVFAALLGSTIVLQAQTNASISVQVSGLNCSALGTGTFTALGWSASATNPGLAAFRAFLSNLVVQKRFDGCSPALFQADVQGRSFPSPTLTQSKVIGGPEGSVPVMTVHLSKVVVTDFRLSGDEKDPNPAESVTFSYTTITIRDIFTGSSFCWNVLTASAC